MGLLSEDVELLEGTLVLKKSKSPLHEGLVWELYELLRGAVGEGFWVLKESPLTFCRSEPEPDLSVVRGHRGDYRFQHPVTAELVIEIAVSTLEIDRRKAGIYADAGVREYWIVIPEERRIEFYRQPQGDTYTETGHATAPEVLSPSVISGIAVDLQRLFGA